ncbi:transporter, partial [Acinetobacter baumannii]
QHFAAGVIFCVLATEVLPDLLHRRMPLVTLVGFSLGVVVMLALKSFAEKAAVGEQASASRYWGLVVAMGIDIALDGLLIGLGF